MRRYFGLIVLWLLAFSPVVQAQELVLVEDFEELSEWEDEE